MSKLDRRIILTGLAGTSLGAAFFMPVFSPKAVSENSFVKNGVGTCQFTPQDIEGPYYFDPEMKRMDITEGRAGQPLKLILNIVDSKCQPIKNARVDIWHADAGGVYSGYSGQGDQRQTSTTGKTYLRGTQFSNRSGKVQFKTIYPGWYPGRTAHLHSKIFIDQKSVLTGQIYFPQYVTDKVYATHPAYEARSTADMPNKRDWLFNRARQNGGGGVVVMVDEKADELLARLQVSVRS